MLSANKSLNDHIFCLLLPSLRQWGNNKLANFSSLGLFFLFIKQCVLPDATSHEEVAELAPHRSPSPPAQAAEEAFSIRPAEDRRFSSEDEGMTSSLRCLFSKRIFAVINCCKNAELAVISLKNAGSIDHCNEQCFRCTEVLLINGCWKIWDSEMYHTRWSNLPWKHIKIILDDMTGKGCCQWSA